LALLPSKAADLSHRHSLKALAHKRRLDVVEFVVANDGLNLDHGKLLKGKSRMGVDLPAACLSQSAEQ
jgi:hypothetical protein